MIGISIKSEKPPLAAQKIKYIIPNVATIVKLEIVEERRFVYVSNVHNATMIAPNLKGLVRFKVKSLSII